MSPRTNVTRSCVIWNKSSIVQCCYPDSSYKCTFYIFAEYTSRQQLISGNINKLAIPTLLIPIVKPFLIHWSWLRLEPFIWTGIRAHGGVTGRQGMFTPLWHLTPPLIYPEVHVYPIFKFVFPTGFIRLVAVRYLCDFIQQSQRWKTP
jgi:hypothetical protein